MADNSSEQEPSIEEILASIRQIISDDDEDSNEETEVVENPVRHKTDDVLELTEEDLDEQDQDEEIETEEEPEPEPEEEPEPSIEIDMRDVVHVEHMCSRCHTRAQTASRVQLWIVRVYV